jgi:hypothetical protein
MREKKLFYRVCFTGMGFIQTNSFKSSLLNRDAPDIRPENSAFFDIRYPAGYRI